MTTNKYFRSITLGAALLGVFCLPSSAHAISENGNGGGNGGGTSQTGTTNISVTTPAFVVLSYYDTINLTLNTPNVDGKISSKDVSVAWNGGDDKETVDAEISGTGGTGVTNLTLQKAWAVRGLSKTGKVSVKIDKAGGDELKYGNSVITMSDYKVSEGTGNASTSIDVALKGLSAGNSTIGNVNLNLDFSRTTMAGKHIGGKFQITATAI